MPFEGLAVLDKWPLHFAANIESYLLLLAYLLAGPVVWMLYGWANLAGMSKMRLLAKPRPAPNPAPLCSILIPAKDEESRIAHCLRSALSQDYPNFEVIAIDDRSTDRTGAILDEMGASDSRLKVRHISPGSLEPNWTGKNNALFQGSKLASGEWLLFVDSDVVLERSALSQTVALCAYKKYDLFSVLPRLETHSFWEQAMIPICSAVSSAMYFGIFVNSDKRNSKAFANGQFMLATGEAYDTIGGHAAVKDILGEDLEIARLMKESGKRIRVSMGTEVCSIRMYDSLPNIVNGWSRIYYAARAGQMRGLLAAAAFLVICCFSVYPALVYGILRAVRPHGNVLDQAWVGAGMLHFLIMTIVLGQLYRWAKSPGWNALQFPMTGLILLWILLKAIIMCMTGRVRWRGTTYSHGLMEKPATR